MDHCVTVPFVGRVLLVLLLHMMSQNETLAEIGADEQL